MLPHQRTRVVEPGVDKQVRIHVGVRAANVQGGEPDGDVGHRRSGRNDPAARSACSHCTRSAVVDGPGRLHQPHAARTLASLEVGIQPSAGRVLAGRRAQQQRHGVRAADNRLHVRHYTRGSKFSQHHARAIARPPIVDGERVARGQRQVAEVQSNNLIALDGPQALVVPRQPQAATQILQPAP